MASGRPLRALKLRFDSGSYVGTILPSPDDRRLLSWASSSIGVWDLPAGRLVRVLKAPQEDGSLRMSASADGKIIAGAIGSALFVWDVESGRLIQGVTGQPATVRHLDFTRDGRGVVTGDRQTICSWDAADGRELHRVSNGTREEFTHHLRCLPDGKTVSWIGHRTTYHWLPGDKRGPERRGTLKEVPVLYDETCTPDGRLLAGIDERERKLKLIDLGGESDGRLVLAEPVAGEPAVGLGSARRDGHRL